MPKLTEQAIKWDMWSEVYDFLDGHHSGYEITPDGQAWFSIFENVSSLRFQGKSGHFTARKEMRNGGKDAYWYAYRKDNGKLVKQYLGKTQELTVARLESVAEGLKNRLRQDSPYQGEVETTQQPANQLPTNEERVTCRYCTLPIEPHMGVYLEQYPRMAWVHYPTCMWHLQAQWEQQDKVKTTHQPESYSLDSGEVETSSDTPHSLQYRIVTDTCAKYGKNIFAQVKHPVRCEFMMLYAACIDLWDTYGWLPSRIENWLQYAQTR